MVVDGKTIRMRNVSGLTKGLLNPGKGLDTPTPELLGNIRSEERVYNPESN